MLKPKIYLDTSVISHLFADDAPDNKRDTIELWRELKLNQYEVIVSPVVYHEFNKCNTQEEREMLYKALNELEYTFVKETEVELNLAEEYLKTGILTEKSFDDCRHIAVASMNNCKYILSWNMKHFVKRKTIEMVKEINEKFGIWKPQIITPAIFIEGGDKDE